jgi:hypothetical protein
MEVSMEFSIEFHGIPWNFYELMERFLPGKSDGFQSETTLTPLSYIASFERT